MALEIEFHPIIYSIPTFAAVEEALQNKRELHLVKRRELDDRDAYVDLIIKYTNTKIDYDLLSLRKAIHGIM